ncbi:MAG TPA: hypothetical protein VF905_01545 [Nitrospirota bacterium]
MNEGWALLLNLVFWISVGSAIVFIWVFGFFELILGASHAARKFKEIGRKASPPSQARDEDLDK